jgi:hypothetical protein
VRTEEGKKKEGKKKEERRKKEGRRGKEGDHARNRMSEKHRLDSLVSYLNDTVLACGGHHRFVA